ncbi:MAG: MerR family transcriptional regulator, partial [bacterium]
MADTRNSTQLFNIWELAEQAGVSRRTVHYYVKEGLLPPPDGRGRNARYREEHLLKLVLIGLLKKSVPLRLEGIRELISPMGPGALRREIRKLG